VDLETELRRKTYEVQLLKEVGDVISSTLDLNEILMLVANKARELINAELLVIPIIDKNTGQYYYAAASGKGVNDVIGVKFSLKIGMCGWVLRNEKPLLFDGEKQQWNVDKKTFWEEGIESALLVPLIGRKGIIGGLSGVAKQDGSQYNQRDLDLLTLFANQVSVAIENAQLFEDLVIAKKEAEKASRLKSEFLANMSHELRTPLNSVLLLSQILSGNKGENLTKIQVKDAQIIHSCGEDLLDLINDILDMAKIESGQIDIYCEDFSIADLLRSVTNMFSSIACEKGLDLVVDIHKKLPKMIKSDKRKVKQILKNLLSNALKFTHQGDVQVKVEIASADLLKNVNFDREMLALSVIDTGIGIKENDIDFIFEPFCQIDSSASRKYAGTGLGLALSRELSRYLGGDVVIQKNKHKGCHFTLFLPLTPSS